MSDSRRFKVLVAVSSLLYVKFYESVFRALAEQGHAVHVVAEREDRSVWLQLMKRLAAEHPGITFAFAPRRSDSWWVDLAYWINRGLEHLRFFATQFDRAPVLRRRAESRALGLSRRLAFAPRRVQPWLGRQFERLLATIETAIRDTRHLETTIAAASPDVVLVTPLVTLGVAQGDVIVAAQRLGIPAAVAVGSWDHLSSKVRIRVRPDRLLVWNETQRTEASTYHGFPGDRVEVTGAQCFDQWFDRVPSRSRADFCRELGLPEDRPVVLYVGSALFWDSPSEAEFTARWVRALRASSNERVRDASILIRPHPKRGYEWDALDFSDCERVVVWPPRGQPPLDAESKATYFDSLYHSAAVVGLNTSAQIEAGLIGRPVYTVLLPEFWDNQEGTLHFHYLLNIEGGLLHAARSLEEHGAQLAEGLRDPLAAAERNRAFVRAFVRPHGLETPATEVFVRAVSRLAAGGPSAGRRSPWWATPCRWLLLPVAAAVWRTAPGSWIARPRRHYAIPAWAWRLRRVVRPLVPHMPPRLFGSVRAWRQAEREHSRSVRERNRMLKAQETMRRRQARAAEKLRLRESRQVQALATEGRVNRDRTAARAAALRKKEKERSVKERRRWQREMKQRAIRASRKSVGHALRVFRLVAPGRSAVAPARDARPGPDHPGGFIDPSDREGPSAPLC